MRFTPLLLALGLIGCGPQAGDEPPQTCGGEGPVRVLEDVSVGRVTYAGDRIFAYVGESFPMDVLEVDAVVVGDCAERPTVIGQVQPDEEWTYGVAGPYALRVAVDGVLDWIDTYGQSASHRLFSDVAGCVLPVAGGLVAPTSDGAVWFHPDPSRADVSPQMLVRSAIAPEYPYTPYFDVADCSLSGTERPVLDGEGVLVAEADGPLVRFALPSGEREVLVEGPVGEFQLLDDPRYLLWRGGSTLHPERDCCSIHVLDRQTGASEAVATGLITGDVDHQGDWLSSFSFGASLEEQQSTFRNYVTGQRIVIDDWWDLQAPLSPTDLLLRRIGEDDPRILDVTTGVLHAVDFPPVAWPQRTYDDGVVAQRLSDSEDTRGDLMRLKFGSREPELWAADIPRDWVRTHGGNLLFIERASREELGPLVLIGEGGAREEVAADVSEFFVPFEGTERERNEVIYFVAAGADRGMWRLVLP